MKKFLKDLLYVSYFIIPALIIPVIADLIYPGTVAKLIGLIIYLVAASYIVKIKRKKGKMSKH